MNTYAHLETDSKLRSAQAMTWIDKTVFASVADLGADGEQREQGVLGKGVLEQDVQEQCVHVQGVQAQSVQAQGAADTIDKQTLLEVVHGLFATGAPVDAIRVWLNKIELSGDATQDGGTKAYSCPQEITRKQTKSAGPHDVSRQKCGGDDGP